MRKTVLFLLFICFILKAQSLFAQDCGTLFATAAITSNYNGSQISCNGANDAAITVVAIGGTAPYTYTFDQFPTNLSGITSGVFSHIPVGGGYTFTAHDVNNCSAVTIQVVVTEPPMLTVSALVTSNYNGFDISCFGNSNGALTAVAAGGIGAYTYLLNPNRLNTSGFSSGVFSGLAAGNYSITVRDINSCEATSVPIALTQPTLLTTSSVINNGLVENCADAAITVSAVGGAGPYTYTLGETQLSSGTFPGLANGVYSILVQDINGCASQTPALEVDQPSNVTMTIVTENITCFGDQNGKLIAIPSGGSGYQFKLLEAPQNLTGLNSGIFTGLNAGEYTVNVRDENQCESSALFVITSPAEITTEIVVTSNYNGAQISCFGALDGKINVQAGGGSGGPYLYTLAGFNNQISSGEVIFTGLGPGDYSIGVEDINGCEVSTSVVALVEPDEISVQETITNTHGNNGSIELMIAGGTLPYTFLWSDESSAQNLLNVSSGEYSILIKDANNCSFTDDYTVPLFVGMPEDNKESIRILYDTHSGKPYLSCLLISPAHVSIQLYDIKGSVNYSIDGRQEAGVQQYSLSSQLLPGLYIARVRIQEKIHLKKFIVF